MSTYFKLGHLIEGIEPIVTAGGNTILTVSSKPIQRFTGTSAQTVTLPDATTLPNNRRFDINNRSTQDVTVNANGGGLVAVVPAGSQRAFVVTDISSAAGSWSVYGITGGGSGGGVELDDKFKLLAGMAGLNLSTENIEARVLKTNVEEMGGNYWANISNLTTAKTGAMGGSLNGFSYAIGGYNGAMIAENLRYSDDSNYHLARTAITAEKGFSGNAFSLNGKLYVAGGEALGGAATGTTYEYTDSTNAWATKTAIGANKELSMIFSDDQYGYHIGGLLTTRSDRYDATLNAWYLISPMPSNRSDAAILPFDSYILIAGGSSTGSDHLNSAISYNQALNSFASESMNFPANRQRMGSAVFGDLAIISMGVDGGGNSNVTYLYEKSSKSYFSAPPATTAKTRPSSSTLNGGILMCGGDVSAVPQSGSQKFNLFSMISVGSLKKSTAVPTSILVGTLSNALASELPVQIRTDGGSWKNLLSGLDSILKTGESLSEKFFKVGVYEIMGGDSAPNTSISGNYNFDDSTNTWATRTALATSRTQPGSFNIEGLAYVVGGVNGASTFLTDMFAFSDLTNAFTAKTSLGVAKRSPGNFELLGKGYLVGGDDGTTTYDTNLQYTAGTNSWLAKTVLPVIKTQMGSFAISGRGHVCNAGTSYSSGATSTDNYQYDPILDAWASRAALGTVRTATNGMMNRDTGYAYIVCGSTSGFDGVGGTVQSLNERYDPAANSWSTVQAATTAREGTSASVSGVGNLIVGGRLAGVTTRTATAELYNPFSNAWSSRTNVPAASRGATTNSAPGNYYNYEVRVGVPAFYAGVGSWVTVTKAVSPVTLAAWGFGIQNTLYAPRGDAGGGGAGVAGVYAYDVEKDSWRQVGNSTYTAAYTGSMALQGFGYMIGGRVAGPTYLTTVSRFNPELALWAATGSLPGGLGYVAGAPLNGFGYSLGGFSGAPVTTVNRYNPSLGTWAAAGNMSVSRYSLDAESASGFIYLGGNTALTFEQYNDVTQSTVFKANVPHLNTDGAALSKGDKFYYFRGGSDVVQEYDTQGNYWSAKPTISVRYYIAASSFGGNFQLAGGSTGLTTNEAYVDSIKNAVLGLALEVK